MAGAGLVSDELLVRPPGILSDAEVVESVREALESRSDIVKAAITAEVAARVVTLQERMTAEDVAMAVPGVRGLSNLLFVDDEEQLEDASRARDLQTAISLAGGLRVATVRAAVAGGVAVLSGTVRHDWQRDLAESIARRMWFLVRNDIELRAAEGGVP